MIKRKVRNYNQNIPLGFKQPFLLQKKIEKKGVYGGSSVDFINIKILYGSFKFMNNFERFTEDQSRNLSDYRVTFNYDDLVGVDFKVGDRIILLENENDMKSFRITGHFDKTFRSEYIDFFVKEGAFSRKADVSNLKKNFFFKGGEVPEDQTFTIKGLIDTNFGLDYFNSIKEINFLVQENNFKPSLIFFNNLFEGENIRAKSNNSSEACVMIKKIKESGVILFTCEDFLFSEGSSLSFEKIRD